MRHYLSSILIKLFKRKKENNWGLKFDSVAKIFREGCIIRARFLNRIADAYENDFNLLNLLLDKTFENILHNYQNSLRKIVGLSIMEGISFPAFTAVVIYFDAYRIKNPTPTKDGYTFERIDKKVFSTTSGKKNEKLSF